MHLSTDSGRRRSLLSSRTRDDSKGKGPFGPVRNSSSSVLEMSRESLVTDVPALDGESVRSEPAESDISRLFSLVRKLHSSSSSSVYLGRALETTPSLSSTPVAVKIRVRRSATRGWPPREAPIMIQLNCHDEKKCPPNLVRLYGSGFADSHGGGAKVEGARMGRSRSRSPGTLELVIPSAGRIQSPASAVGKADGKERPRMEVLNKNLPSSSSSPHQQPPPLPPPPPPPPSSSSTQQSPLPPALPPALPSLSGRSSPSSSAMSLNSSWTGGASSSGETSTAEVEGARRVETGMGAGVSFRPSLRRHRYSDRTPSVSSSTTGAEATTAMPMSMSTPAVLSVLSVVHPRHLPPPAAAAAAQDTKEAFWTVQELAAEGDLLRFVASDQPWMDGPEPGSEAEAATVLGDILHGLRAMHDRHIAHLNLSLETVLVCYVGGESENGERRRVAKLGSFHRATSFTPGVRNSLGRRGRRPMRLSYAPPEMLRGQMQRTYVAPLADVYSAGIIAFVLLTGHPPYARPHTRDLRFGLVSAGEPGVRRLLESYRVRHLSGHAVGLVSQMLSREDVRPTLAEVMTHEFFMAPYAQRPGGRRKEGRERGEEERRSRRKEGIGEAEEANATCVDGAGSDSLVELLLRVQKDDAALTTEHVAAIAGCVRCVATRAAVERDLAGVSSSVRMDIWNLAASQTAAGGEARAVTVAREWQRVVRVSLPNQDLRRVPRVLFLARGLVHLDLSCNHLWRLPDSIRAFSGLRTLRLGNNALRELPAAVGALRSLETLILEVNNLSVLPPEIGLLRGLRFLVLRRNMLRALPDTVGRLRNLEVLHLGCNQLESLPRTVGGMRSLRSLLLSRNRLRQLPIAELSRLGQLETIDLMGNEETLPQESLLSANGFLEAVERLRKMAQSSPKGDVPPRRIFRGVPNRVALHRPTATRRSRLSNVLSPSSKEGKGEKE